MTAAPASASPAPDRVLAGVGLMLFFCAVAPLIDVASKSAAQGVSVGLVTFGRFAVQGLLMLPLVLILREGLRCSRRAFRLVLARAATNVLSTLSFIGAVQVMPIADALAIAFVEPFVILLIGRFVMQEEVGPRRLAAAVVGFGGALLVIQPSFVNFGLKALLPLGTAVTFALYMLITRALSREMKAASIQLHTALLGSLICLPLLAVGHVAGIAPLDPALPQTADLWLWCLAVGVAATISHIAITYALAFTPSSTLAPLHYLEIVTATLFGYLFFGDFPGGKTWTGIAIIVASGLYVIHREALKSRQNRQARPATEALARPVRR